MTNKDDVEHELDDLERVQEFYRPRLERAENAYGRALTYLWAGNGGGALAIVGIIGATWDGNTFAGPLLWPLAFFVFGLISMGVGTALSLHREAAAIKKMETARSLFELPAGSGQRPSQAVGLTYKDWRTRMGLLAAVFFLAGCFSGLIVAILTYAN